MRSILVAVLCITLARVPIFAADSVYNVRYNGVSIPNTGAGIGLKLYIDSDAIRLMRDKTEVATILASSVREISFDQEIRQPVGTAIGAPIRQSKSSGYDIGPIWNDGAKVGGAAFQSDKNDIVDLLARLEVASGKKAVDSEALPQTQDLAEMPQAPEAYQSEFVIAEFKSMIPPLSSTKTDVTIEATHSPGVFKTSGKQEFDISTGQLMTWYAGARHTIKGKVTIEGYTFVSDPNNPLVFSVYGQRGYVYEKGRGVVITPSNEHVFLQTGLDAAGLMLEETYLFPSPEKDRGKFPDMTLPAKFSPDGKHMAYAACRAEAKSYVKIREDLFASIGSECLTVVDGHEVGADYDQTYSPTLSPDGKRVAYTARKGKKSLVVVDGQEVGAEFDEVWGPTFGPEGRHLVYIAKKDGKWLEVTDGQAGMEYDTIDTKSLVFSPDGKRLAYAAKKGTKWLVVLDGQEVGVEYDYASYPSFSPDSKHTAYAAKRGTKLFWVVDGRPGAEYDRLAVPIFSPDGKHVAYFAKNGAWWLVVVDGQEMGVEYDEGGASSFSPDGKHFAYAAKKGAKVSLVLDGQSSVEYDGVSAPTFSPDGKNLAYLAQKGARWLVVVDGQAGTEYDSIDAESLIFSPDSKRVAYAAQKGGKRLVVVDGHEVGAEYDETWDPTFSPDGKHVAYVAKRGFWDSFVVLDRGYPGARYYEIQGSPIFNSDGILEFLASKEYEYYRVRYIPKQ
jgi:Tol biopolymer transport system component